MKMKVESEYTLNGYKIRIIKPDITEEERKKENVKLVKRLRDIMTAEKRI